MKQILSFLFLFLAFSCTQKIVPQKTVTIQTYEDKNGRVQLIGETDKNALMQEPYNQWFRRKDDYTPDAEIIAQLSKELKDITIEAFYGSWCGDSKRDVPKFYKILEETGYDTNQLTIVAVGNTKELYKKSPDGEHEGKNIKRVPTFIFYNKQGQEMGRIVESAVETLEKDMLAIITGKPYKHKYQN